jgi:ABC-2 type transport system permease protein
MNKAAFRQFWGFFITALKSSFRNPSALFFGFFFPLIFIFSFAFFDNSGVTFDMGIVQNNDPQFSIFKDAVTNSNIFKIHEGSKDDLLNQLEKSNLDVVVDYTGNNTLQVTTNSSKPQNNPVILQTISTINDKISLNGQPTVYNIDQQSLNGRTGKYIDFVLPGILGFSILTAAISGTAFSFVSLKKTLALKRLFATPAKSAPFIAGQSAARMVFGLAQNLILLLVAMVFFGYSPQGGLPSLINMLVIILFGSLVFLGMGYIVAGVAKNEDQAGPLSNILTLPQFLLAGTFFQVSSLPDWLQNVAKLLPLYNFNEAMRYVSLDGQALWSPEVSMQLLFLVLWAIVIYVIAGRVFSVKAS